MYALLHQVHFSNRQRAVIEELIQHKSNAEIGSALGIDPKTVKWHMTIILRKLSLKSRRQVIAWYNGIVEPPIEVVVEPPPPPVPDESLPMGVNG